MSTAYHLPVLVEEVCEALAPVARAATIVDCTLGGGGHSEVILERFGAALVIGIDRDPEAIAFASQRLARFGDRFRAIHAPFSNLRAVLDQLEIPAVAGVLADLGVSSHQLDRRERGFSFQGDAALDMRMDPTVGITAAQVLATIDAKALSRILRKFGDETDASRIARAIVQVRPTTTAALATIVETSMSARQRRQLGKRIHPATRTFQALRMHVNRELDELDQLLADAPKLLLPGGRIAMISFHSLEDRAVKRRFVGLTKTAELPLGLPIPAAELPAAPFLIPRGFRQGKTASDTEREHNPRSRSARVRVLERAA